jgi:AraC family transcriptional regulator, transcriptional activator of pobA
MTEPTICLYFPTDQAWIEIMTEPVLPHYFLYGEPEQTVRPDFVHVESLENRSRPENWTIRPHMHGDLNHIILIAGGGGNIFYEGESIAFEAPRLLVVPARIAHGFDWHRESRGLVLTIAAVHLSQLVQRHPELGRLFAQPCCLALETTDSRQIEATMQALIGELSWIGLGQAAAVEAALLGIFVAASRALERSGEATWREPRKPDLVARYRELVEQRFRRRESVGTYARALGVSPTTLREACAEIGQSPTRIRDRRTILETQRLLAYSALTIAEIGETVGFEDPAYFSRFFSRNCGQPPNGWREMVKVPHPKI